MNKLPCSFTIFGKRMKYLMVLFLFFWSSVKAQKSFEVELSLSRTNSSLANSLNYQAKVTDSLLVYKEAEKLITQLQFKGYLLAEVKSIIFNVYQAKIEIDQENQFKLISLLPGNLSADAQNAVGFKQRNFSDTYVDLKKLNQLFEGLLNYYDANGYPFASLSLDSINIFKESISAKINVKLNEKFVYDTLELIGSAKLNKRFLQTYLNIKPKAAYSENAIKNTNNRLAELPYLTVLRSPEVSFTGNTAKALVFVNKRNANQFDGILGLQQNPVDNKVQVIGNLKLRLQNAFQRGELVDLNYQGLQERSQLLELKADVPNVLNTDFGINPSLRIYKQDTSFLNVDVKLGFSYLFKGYNALQFYVENQSTSLVAVDAYQNATQLPVILDAATTFYGLGFNFEKLDYRYNPTKGYAMNLSGSVGNKRIRKNSAIPEILYNDVSLNSTSYKFQSRFNYYLPLNKLLVFTLYNETGIIAGKYLIDNELFRLGGQRSLRGFNELSLLANAYTYANAEMRYLLGQNSFLFAFYNQAYLQQRTNKADFEDFPLGFGTGINFETSVGIVSLSYALGKQRNNPVNLRQGKIHFGIIALF